MALRTAVENCQASIEKNDLELFFNLVGDFKPQTVLEIGMWRGYSTHLWDQYFKPNILVTVENDADSIEFMNKQRSDRKTKFNLPPFVVVGDSHSLKTSEEVEELLKKNLVDFMFIDGDHSYEGVKKDWQMYSKFLAPNAIVLFHDVVYTALNPDVQVKPFWEESRDKYNWVEIKSKNSTGCGVLFT